MAENNGSEAAIIITENKKIKKKQYANMYNVYRTCPSM